MKKAVWLSTFLLFQMPFCLQLILMWRCRLTRKALTCWRRISPPSVEEGNTSPSVVRPSALLVNWGKGPNFRHHSQIESIARLSCACKRTDCFIIHTWGLNFNGWMWRAFFFFHFFKIIKVCRRVCCSAGTHTSEHHFWVSGMRAGVGNRCLQHGGRQQQNYICIAPN